MLKCRKGNTVCVIDYPRFGEIYQTTVISSGNKYIKVKEYPYLRFDATTLYNVEGGGRLFVGTKQQYFYNRQRAQERAIILERIKRKLTELSINQLNDIEHQLSLI